MKKCKTCDSEFPEQPDTVKIPYLIHNKGRKLSEIKIPKRDWQK